MRERADLREEKLKFLVAMIEMAQRYEWLLMDMNGNLIEPNFGNVIELIKASNSYKFLKYPLKFLTELGKAKQQEKSN